MYIVMKLPFLPPNEGGSMYNHDFSYAYMKDEVTGEHYKKCGRCGKVMFLTGDETFNMICQPLVQTREDVRKRLEGESNP